MREFQDRPSRLDCAFFFETLDEMMLYIRSDTLRTLHMLPYEVELVSPGAVQHAADWNRLPADSNPEDLQTARAYWRGDLSPAQANGVCTREILAKTAMRIVQKLPFIEP